MNKWLVAIAFSVLLLVPVGAQDAFALLCPQIPGCITGNFYVLDNNFGIIRQHDSAGTIIDPNFITGLGSSSTFAFDADGNLYVGDFSSNNIAKYDSAGTIIDPNFITGVGSVGSIVFDTLGNLYVLGGAVVSKYDSTGALLNANLITGIPNPGGEDVIMAFGPDGFLYIPNLDLGRIFKYSSTGALLDSFFITGLAKPHAIAFDAAGNVYVAQRFNVVSQYDSTGSPLNTNFITDLREPISLAFDSAGNLYVGDIDTSFISPTLVRQYDSTGALLNSNFSPGLSDGLFIIPLAFDRVPPDEALTCGPKTFLNEQRQCVPDLDAICGSGTIPDFNLLMCFGLVMGAVGGELLEINTVSLLVAAIGTNPVITALVGITIAGVAGQAVWFIHKRKNRK